MGCHSCGTQHRHGAAGECDPGGDGGCEAQRGWLQLNAMPGRAGGGAGGQVTRAVSCERGRAGDGRSVSRRRQAGWGRRC